MHRQSLGSPTRTHLHPAVAADGSAADSIPPPPELKSLDKPSRPRPDRSIHLIPVLLFSCLLVLYLLSHDPTPKDMANFSGGAAVLAASKVVSATDKVGSAAAVRENRGLKAAADRRLNRKLGTRLQHT